MALGNIGKPNVNLMDTLLLMKELMNELKGSEYIEHINELKEKTDSYNAAKAAAEPVIHSLNSAKDDHEKSVIELKANYSLLSNEKIDHDNRLKKIVRAQEALDASKKEHEVKVAGAHLDIEQKHLKISDRERAADAAHNLALSVKAEYEKKLGDLKKITG